MITSRTILLFLLLVFCLSFAYDKVYRWKMELPAGSGRFQENWVEGKWPMGIKPVIAFENKLYVIGQKLTWVSNDGKNWKAHTKIDWGERHGMSTTFFKGKIWVMGGMKSWDKFLNDIWCSSDGINWNRVKENAEWTERRNHCVIVQNNKMMLLGGALSSGRADQTPKEFLNDIWISEDGKNWTKEPIDAGWSPRNPEIVKFKDQFFLIGVEENPEIWSSGDGIKWTMNKTRSPFKGRLNFGLVEFDNSLWFFGGRGHNDVWSSFDGISWTRQFSKAPWSTRTTNNSMVFADKLWIYSGKTGREDSWSGEVWTMAK